MQWGQKNWCFPTDLQSTRRPAVTRAARYAERDSGTSVRVSPVSVAVSPARFRFDLLPELFVGDAARGPAPAAVRSAAKAPGDRPRAARPRPRLADLLAGRFQDRPEPLRVRHDQALRNSARLTMSSAERAAASFRRRRNCSPME